MITTRSTLVLALLLAATAPASAQSLFSTRGLGVPMPAVDARTAALGGIGVGLIGFHTSLTSPAELGGVTRRGVSAGLQPVNASFDAAGVEEGTSGTRFPLIRVIFPISNRLVTSIGYGSYLEQSWGIRRESSQVIGETRYTVNDLLRSRGGIAQGRISAAYSVTPSLAVGAAVGMFTGNVERLVVRGFVDTAGIALNPMSEQHRWRYTAPLGAVGVRWDLFGRVRVGASAMMAGDVEARAVSEGAPERTYTAPLELAGGLSARLTPLLMATGGAVWSRMPGTGEDVVTDETLRVGGGIEYQGLRSGLRTYPLRLGASWSQLPYHQAGETAATEWSVGGGLGFRLGDPMDPAAVADIGVQRGRRSGLDGPALSGGLSESLWRFNFSLSLFAR